MTSSWSSELNSADSDALEAVSYVPCAPCLDDVLAWILGECRAIAAREHSLVGDKDVEAGDEVSHGDALVRQPLLVQVDIVNEDEEVVVLALEVNLGLGGLSSSHLGGCCGGLWWFVVVVVVSRELGWNRVVDWIAWLGRRKRKQDEAARRRGLKGKLRR
jgi:hypothetical protein